jgi:hypothetical protein
MLALAGLTGLRRCSGADVDVGAFGMRGVTFRIHQYNLKSYPALITAGRISAPGKAAVSADMELRRERPIAEVGAHYSITLSAQSLFQRSRRRHQND